jgi:hypothetical protein
MPKTLTYEIVSTDPLVVESATARIEERDGEGWKETKVVDIQTTGPSSTGSLLMSADQRVIFEDARMVALYDEEQMATIMVKATDIPEGQMAATMSVDDKKKLLAKLRELRQKETAGPLTKAGAGASPKVEPPKGYPTQGVHPTQGHAVQSHSTQGEAKNEDKKK